jgi:hypothetical protein
VKRTLKACPGCGAKNTARRVDQVCEDCAHAIRCWNEHVAATNARPDLATVRLKGAYHWYPMFYGSGPREEVEGFTETRDELGRLFAELGELSCISKFHWKDSPRRRDDEPECEFLFVRPVVRRPPKKGRHYGEQAVYPASEGSACSNPLYGKMNSRTLEVIRLLWDRTARFAEMAYLGGVQDGRNLLLQLSSGALSIDDLQKWDMNLARERQNAKYLYLKLKRRRTQPAWSEACDE